MFNVAVTLSLIACCLLGCHPIPSGERALLPSVSKAVPTAPETATFLQGRVTGPNGQPLPHATVDLHPVVHPLTSVTRTETDDQGRFRLAMQETAETWMVTATHDSLTLRAFVIGGGFSAKQTPSDSLRVSLASTVTVKALWRKWAEAMLLRAPQADDQLRALGTSLRNVQSQIERILASEIQDARMASVRQRLTDQADAAALNALTTAIASYTEAGAIFSDWVSEANDVMVQLAKRNAAAFVPSDWAIVGFERRAPTILMIAQDPGVQENLARISADFDTTRLAQAVGGGSSGGSGGGLASQVILEGAIQQ